MNKLFGILTLMLLISVGFGLTGQKIGILDEVSNKAIILDMGDNSTAIEVSLDYKPVSIKRAKDGSTDFVVTAKNSANINTREQITDSKIYLITEAGTIKKTIATPKAVFDCVKTTDYYYCGFTGQNTDYIFKYSLTGTLINETSLGAVSSAMSYYGLDYDPIYDVIYKVRDPNTTGIQSWIYTLDPDDFSTIGAVQVTSSNPIDIIEYLSPTDRLMVDGNSSTDNDIFFYALTSNRTLDFTTNSSYTAVYPFYPKRTDVQSYISYNHTIGIIQEFDGSTNRNYTVNITSGTGFNKGVLYTYLSAENNNPLNTLEVRTSAGVTGCEQASAISGTCQLTGQYYGYNYSVTTDSDQSQSANLTIYSRVRGLTKDYQIIYSSGNESEGALKPYEICWPEAEISGSTVGGSGLSSIDYESILADEQTYEGFRITMKSSNAKWENWGGLIQHWYKGNGLTGGYVDNDPVIMSGKYATPIIISMTPEYELNEDYLTWDYTVKQNPSFAYNDKDNRQLWEEFHTLLPYNTTHYYLSNWTWTDDGWDRETDYVDWDTANATLVEFGLSIANIDELLTEFDYSTPYNYVPTANILTLYGYAWGVTNQSGSDTFTWPSCATAYEAVTFDCDSALIEQTAYPEQSLCDIPINTERTFKILTPNIEVFPIITAQVELDQFYNSSEQVVSDIYNYSCTSINSTSTITGQVAVYSDMIIPVTFDNLTTRQPLAYLLTIVNSDNVGQQLVSVTTQYATQYTNASGQVYFYGIRPNEFLNVTLNFLGKTISYTGGLAQPIGDYFNSQRYSDAGYCTGFDGVYKYTLPLNPSVKDKDWKVTCGGKIIIPDASIYIDGVLQNITNSSGQAHFIMYQDYNTEGFNVTVTSNAGNYTQVEKDLTSATKTIYLQSCNETALINQGYEQESFNIESLFSALFNPFVIGFLIVVGLTIVIWLKTGSTEIVSVSFSGLMIIFYYLGLIPLFAVVILIMIIAGFFAMKISGRI